MTAHADWKQWSCRMRLVVTHASVLPAARELVDSYLAKVDDAANRFRDDAETVRLSSRSGWATLSPTLADLLGEALEAARFSDGDVDPTVGAAMRRVGYDRDIELVTGDNGPVRAVVRPVPGHRRVRLVGAQVHCPRGTELDLGATAKAVAADRAAELVHQAFGTGVLVALGGDIATAGSALTGGWQVRVEDGGEQVALPAGAAIATSSTVSRRWQRGARTLHHVVDPRTGQPARRVWRTVTVAAATCLHANTVTTASLVRGERALDWVRGLGLPARFVREDGTVVTTPGWPTSEVAA